MIRKWIYLACLLAGVAAWNGATVYAQTDIAASIDGAFSGATQSGTPQPGVDSQSPSNSAGALLEVRHIHNSLVGFEGAYSYNRANQTYSYTFPLNAPTTPCPSSGCRTQPITVAVSAYAQSITGDWLISRKMRNFRPFALAGGGILLVVPSGGQTYTGYNVTGQYLNNATYTYHTTEFVLVFGAGLDWKLSSHLGLRLQDRENIYKSPQLLSTQIYPFGSSGLKNDLTTTQEPALGVYYRF